MFSAGRLGAPRLRNVGTYNAMTVLVAFGAAVVADLPVASSRPFGTSADVCILAMKSNIMSARTLELLMSCWAILACPLGDSGALALAIPGSSRF